MDAVAIITDLGFPIAAALGLGMFESSCRSPPGGGSIDRTLARFSIGFSKWA
jgi:hypothetical protein